MMKYVLLVFCAAFASMAHATQGDSIQIVGRVSDAGDRPIEALIVAALHPTDSSVVAYSMTDMEGQYRLRLASGVEEVLVRLTGFNIKRETRRVRAVSQTVDFRAEEDIVTLREVQIKAQKLWGNRDTLNYLVAAYMTEHDRTIGDVLKQLPGITIEGGVIKYQGTPINHFYIENIDLLQGRYSLATEGIKAEDVSTVQVLENHEHVKALQDQVPPESAAINIKLKEKAKGVWSKSFAVALGYDDKVLWNTEANMMYFAKHRQHIMYYGNDNTGKGCDRSGRHYGGKALEASVLTDILYPGSSPVGISLRNNAHSLHSSNMQKLSKTASLNYSLTYNHDLQTSSSFLQTSYQMPGSDMVVTSEDIAARRITNDVSLQLKYENNDTLNFLSSAFELAGQWADADGTVQTQAEATGSASSSAEEIYQHSQKCNLGLANDTRWVHRTTGGAGFEFRSRSSVQTTPHSLSVSGDMEARQNIDITKVSTANTFSLIRNLRRHRWTIAPTAGLNVDYVGLESLLKRAAAGEEAEPLPLSDSGNKNYVYTKGSLDATVRYVKNEFRMSLHLPLNLSHTYMRGEISKARLRFSPSFSLLWKADDHWTLSGGGSYGMHQTPWSRLITSYIMSNYRTTSRYKASIEDSYRAKANAKLQFKDIMSSFFAYVQGDFSRSWSNIIYGTTIDPQGHTIMEAQYMPHHENAYSFTGNISKGFDWKSARLELNTNYTRTSSTVLRQGIDTDYHSNAFSIHGNVSLSPVRAVRVGYDCNFSSSMSVSAGYEHTVHTFSQHASINISLISNSLLGNITGRHTYNNGFSGKKNYAFLDMSLTYRTKKKLEFSIEADNLFNTKSFVSRSDTDLTQYLQIYHLRPRSFVLSTRVSL